MVHAAQNVCVGNKVERVALRQMPGLSPQQCQSQALAG
ncbi:hypothetical protein C943_00643 [Mariniradius saccharolyticus AK6]|uniref:Uncharacterized protein n=1 Tax=Mariniradius saccharolyticus AK6 TaxID=1239962 RepID=M7X7M1_9BACT|nr:hypothetical protein C943_00643 [Mariniradius saccharolyticus AK6]